MLLQVDLPHGIVDTKSGLGPCEKGQEHGVAGEELHESEELLPDIFGSMGPAVKLARYDA